jgi:hypothetical protein
MMPFQNVSLPVPAAFGLIDDSARSERVCDVLGILGIGLSDFVGESDQLSAIYSSN